MSHYAEHCMELKKGFLVYWWDQNEQYDRHEFLFLWSTALSWFPPIRTCIYGIYQSVSKTLPPGPLLPPPWLSNKYLCFLYLESLHPLSYNIPVLSSFDLVIFTQSIDIFLLPFIAKLFEIVCHLCLMLKLSLQSLFTFTLNFAFTSPLRMLPRSPVAHHHFQSSYFLTFLQLLITVIFLNVPSPLDFYAIISSNFPQFPYCCLLF